MCREPIDGAKHPIPQVVYRWRIAKICAIYFQNGVILLSSPGHACLLSLAQRCCLWVGKRSRLPYSDCWSAQPQPNGPGPSSKLGSEAAKGTTWGSKWWLRYDTPPAVCLLHDFPVLNVRVGICKENLHKFCALPGNMIRPQGQISLKCKNESPHFQQKFPHLKKQKPARMLQTLDKKILATVSWPN